MSCEFCARPTTVLLQSVYVFSECRTYRTGTFCTLAALAMPSLHAPRCRTVCLRSFRDVCLILGCALLSFRDVCLESFRGQQNRPWCNLTAGNSLFFWGGGGGVLPFLPEPASSF
eukprot:jgi/Botrbrau1/22907/Bobra.0065s0059.1